MLEDIKENKTSLYDKEIVNTLHENNFKLDAKTTKILANKFDNEWKDKCERSLKLAKMLGNTYTGSLYNGLITLLCDNTIDLAGKKVLMFSYGSGCASSMFFVHVNPGYKTHSLVINSQFQERLDSRVQISAQEYDNWMSHRESLFGKCDYEPQVSLTFLMLIFRATLINFNQAPFT